MTERPESDDTPLGDTDEHSDVPSDENAPSPAEYEGSEEREGEDPDPDR